ncbi:MAG: putative Ig domain-containing protein, partial [Acidobacteriota bacterium]
MLFVANGDSRNLTTFSVNTSTGALTTLATQPANTLGATGTATDLAYLLLPCSSITLSPTTLPAGTVNATYNQIVTASPSGTYTYTVTTGALPAGLSLNATTGAITGTPTTAGTSNFTITALSFGPCSGSQAYSITISQGNTAPSITPVAVARQAGNPVSNSTIATVSDAETVAGALTVNINGGASATVNNITVSNLANTSGTITANVVAACNATLGATNFTINVSDGSLTTPGTLQVTVNANSPPTLTYGNQSVTAGGSVGFGPASGPADNGAVSSIVVQSQGTYTGAISVNNSTGVVSLSGAKPYGTHTITIRATDNCGAFTDASFTLTVNCPAISLSPATLPNGTVGTGYNQTITASGGAPAYSFTLVSGTLPTGLSLTTGGSLSGTPSAGSTFSFTVKANDQNGCTGMQAYSVTINTPPTINVVAVSRQQASPASNSTIANVTDPDQVLNTLTVAVNGSSSATLNGVTVSGISVSAAGVVTANVVASCTATNAGFSLAVTDNASASTNATLNVTVTANSAPTLTYSNQSVASGGSLNVTPATASDNGSITGFSVQSVTPPLTTTPTVNSSGVVSITNANPSGLHTITIRATDNCGATTDGSFTVNVGCPTITLSPATLPNGTVGAGYNQTIIASGGVAPYSFMLLSGTLPTGLSLSTGGGLSGTPSAGGTFNFTVKATDNSGCTGVQAYSVAINTPPVIGAVAVSRQQGSPSSNSTIANVSDADQTANTLTVTVNGGSSATVNGMTVSGISISGAGAVTANIIASCTAINASFTLTVTDSATTSNSATLNVTVTANSAPTLTYS